MPELWRRWTPRWPSEGQDSSSRKSKWPKDLEESLFCESLLGLMQRCGRFDYMTFDDDVQEEKEGENGTRRLLMQLRANHPALSLA